MRRTVPLVFIMMLALLSLLLWRSTARQKSQPPRPAQEFSLAAAATLPKDVHFDAALRNVRRLTDNPGGHKKWDNAEAYFSPDGRTLVFQSTRDTAGCDIIYAMAPDGTGLRQVSSGKGRTTCGFFSPDGRWIVYASTHPAGDGCPPPPDQTAGYTWAVYATYDIFKMPTSGGVPIRLTDTPGYDAECVFRPDGKRVLFTSDRDGDLELYDMDPEGHEVRRLTQTPGYDGGGCYTADGQRIVFRARHPQGEELLDYRRLLAQHLIRPARLDLFMMDADGGNPKQLTAEGDKGVTSWAPYPHPDGHRIVYASNRDDFDGTLKGRYGFNFELYLLDLADGSSRRLTWNPAFDGFPMFSPDGRRLVWCGNYVPDRPRDTDVVIGDWADPPPR
jgi:TolB protein